VQQPSLSAALLLACLAIVGCETGSRDAGATANPGDYVGVQYHVQSLPAGVIDEGGMMIESPDEHEYGVAFRRTTDGRQLLWLQRLTARDAQGLPSWEVLAVLELPPLADGEHMMPIECTLVDAPAVPVVAVGRYPDYDEVSRPRTAWRVDVATASFAPVDAARVECRQIA
jgi:hypothetical protein